jgi:two-component system OmpR family response regulator
MALRMEGWEVRSAGSGFDALAQAREFDPDAMVLDIMTTTSTRSGEPSAR